MVCQAFNCPPDVALRQDWALVKGILDYRNAETAIELFNRGGKGVAALQSAPHLVGLLVEMHRAQGADASEAGVYADMAARPEADE